MEHCSDPRSDQGSIHNSQFSSDGVVEAGPEFEILRRMNYLTEVAGPPVTEAPSTWIFDRIEEWAKRFPNRFAFAVDHQDRIEEYGYSEVLKQADAIAAELRAKGIQPGDR